MAPSPLTPRAGAPPVDDVTVGDNVEVPGNMQGTVRFIGTIPGKKGMFAGVELHSEFAQRGKNNGDVEGYVLYNKIHYVTPPLFLFIFYTLLSGHTLSTFISLTNAPLLYSVSYFTTTVPNAGIFLPLNKAIRRDSPPNSTTSSFPMTPASVTGGLKVGTQNSTNTPPTPSVPQFSKSVGPGRASSPLAKKPRPSLRPESPVRKLQLTPVTRPSIGTPAAKSMPRYGSPTHNKFSKSVNGAGAPGDPAKKGMLQTNRNVSMGPRSTSALSSTGFVADDSMTMPLGNGVSMPRDLGRSPSVSKSRGPSRQAMGQDEEIERLRAELADRNRQLKEQTATLADMESSLTEVQNLMEQAEMPPPPPRRGSLDDKDTSQLRALVREKNEKIAMLTAEFDAHRADFRSTIDTLELASNETERVYEKRIEELMQDIQQIQDRTTDVDVVATQLKQLEELVQELEEGLEDARRGEAEARGEVEFLRGEVERTRAELRREREKAAAATNGTNGPSNGDHSALFRELEQKEDEIRGLKAIIHSLSSNSVPGEGGRPHVNPDDTLAREKLEREVAELRALLDTKNSQEEELKHELEGLRRGSAATLKGINNRSTVRDSRDTVVLANESEGQQSQRKAAHIRVRTLDTMPESDGVSSVTEQSAVWCELCESSGHDILTCTNMFGNQTPKDADETPRPSDQQEYLAPIKEDEQYKIAPLSPRLPPANFGPPAQAAAPAPAPAPAVKSPPPNLMEPGPVAGKESGVIDADAWCALCEKDGHTSVDCPFEENF